MVRIRATCPQCENDVELTSVDVTALVCTDTGEGSYAFRCPECDIAVSVEADARIIDLLVDRGVAKRMWNLPAELAEAKRGEALQYDDLLDLHFVLQRETWFEDVEALTVGSMVPTDELSAMLTGSDPVDAAAVAKRFGTSVWLAQRAMDLHGARPTTSEGVETA
jgi:hypothetical protein